MEINWTYEYRAKFQLDLESFFPGRSRVRSKLFTNRYKFKFFDFAPKPRVNRLLRIVFLVLVRSSTEQLDFDTPHLKHFQEHCSGDRITLFACIAFARAGYNK